MRKLILAMGTAATVAFATPAIAQQDPGLKDIVEAYWAYQLEQYPEFASSLGVDDPVGRARGQGKGLARATRRDRHGDIKRG